MAGQHDPSSAIARAAQALKDFFVEHQRLLAPLLAIVSAAIAIPLAVLALLPTILSWFASPMDMSQDLYAVNRPVAFTFLDADGNAVGHRGAITGERLGLDEMR